MPKIVVNNDWGGFALSEAAILRYAEIKGINLVCMSDPEFTTFKNYYLDGIKDDDHHFSQYDIDRDDPALVQAVEELGKAADGDYASLRIANVPDDVKWYIHDYDGIETIHEEHRSW